LPPGAVVRVDLDFPEEADFDFLEEAEDDFLEEAEDDFVEPDRFLDAAGGLAPDVFGRVARREDLVRDSPGPFRLAIASSSRRPGGDATGRRHRSHAERNARPAAHGTHDYENVILPENPPGPQRLSSKNRASPNGRTRGAIQGSARLVEWTASMPVAMRILSAGSGPAFARRYLWRAGSRLGRKAVSRPIAGRNEQTR
jgi:hypothetical protein